MVAAEAMSRVLGNRKKGEATKWPRANAGLWGPKKVSSKSGYAYGIHLVAMADPVAGWLEMAQLHGPPAAKRCQAALGAAWLAKHRG